MILHYSFDSCFSNDKWCWAFFHVFISYLCVFFGKCLLPTFWLSYLFFWYLVVWATSILRRLILCQLLHLQWCPAEHLYFWCSTLRPGGCYIFSSEIQCRYDHYAWKLQRTAWMDIWESPCLVKCLIKDFLCADLWRPGMCSDDYTPVDVTLRTHKCALRPSLVRQGRHSTDVCFFPQGRGK